MKTTWRWGIALVAVATAATGWAAGPANRVEIEKTSPSGVKLEISKEIAAPAGAKSAEPAAVPPEGPHKARLAVMPARFAEQFAPVVKVAEAIKVTGAVDVSSVFSAENESHWKAPSFTAALVESFVSCRKFDVLERTRLEEVLQEVDFGQSDYGDPAKVIPFGKAAGADFVVLPEIQSLELLVEAKDVPYVDRVQLKYRGKIIARSRVVDVASTKVVSAATEEVRVERKPKPAEPFMATEIDSLAVDLYRVASQRLMSRALETIYPLKLLEIKDQAVVVNRGEGAIRVGDEFTVFTFGQEYVDPDTKEPLGRSEEPIAKIKVVSVAPKTAQARIVSGAERLKAVPADYVCRETEESVKAKTTLPPQLMYW